MAVLSNDEIDQRLRALPGWLRQGSAIVHQFAFKGFPEAVAFVSRLVPGAEAADHHPDLSVTWGRITVKLSTHSAGGITDKDFELARRIEDAALWRPGDGSALRGTQGKWVRGGDPR